MKLLAPPIISTVTLKIETPGKDTIELTGLLGEVEVNLRFEPEPDFDPEHPDQVMFSPAPEELTVTISHLLANAAGKYYTVKITAPKEN